MIDIVFFLIGSDADLTILENLGMKLKNSTYGVVPIYDEETFETDIAGVYVVGHFTVQISDASNKSLSGFF